MLVLLSSGTRRQHAEIDEQWLSEVPRSSRITYIPSSVVGPQFGKYFAAFKRYYAYYGLKNVLTLSHEKASPRQLKEALASEVLFLSGGNTFSLTAALRSSGIWAPLSKIVSQNKKVIIGVSAGAIMLTPNIWTAAVGPIVDTNEAGLKDLRGFAATPFYFSPHFDETDKLTKAIQRESNKRSLPVLCCPDGSGVLVTGSGTKKMWRGIGSITCVMQN